MLRLQRCSRDRKWDCSHSWRRIRLIGCRVTVAVSEWIVNVLHVTGSDVAGKSMLGLNVK